MGRKRKQQKKQPPPESFKNVLSRLGLPASRANCDQFSTITGNTDSFKWSQLQSLVKEQLLSPPSLLPKSDAEEGPSAGKPADLSILVSRCGSSKLSDYLYGSGFEQLTNVDFSEMVIVDKLSTSNVRKWRVWFPDKTFDAVVDKGGLDALALMVPTPASTSPPVLYIHKVKRILKAGGKYICLTLAESNVLDILFNNFRFGWKMSIYAISKEPSSGKLKPQTFMVVAEKDICVSVSEISTFLDENNGQVHELRRALKREQEFRSEYSKGCNKLYSLEELDLEDLKDLEPGRRKKVILGEPGGPYFYKGVLADAQKDSGSFSYQFAVYIVARNRVDEWLFSSEEGQEQVAANSKAARLLIILLDSSNYFSSNEYIEMELNLDPLARQLAPRDWDGVRLPVMIVDEVIKLQATLHEVTTASTGTIIVEEVIYHKILNDDDDHLVFRRLTFKRSVGMVESEVLLYKVLASSKTRKKGKQKNSGSPGLAGALLGNSSYEMKIDHNYLTQPYQNAIISGLLLISPHLIVSSISTGVMVETMVIGLGGGSLPMFMKNWLPDLNIEVVELDPMVLDVAKQHFGFIEDKQLLVRIGDGIDFVREKADSEAEGDSSRKLDILIVDVNFPNSSSGLTFPSPAFAEESFLQNAKNSLSEKGLFVINVVCWSSTSRARIYSSLKKVFGKTLHFKGDDGHEVVFALKNESEIMTEDGLSEACKKLERSLGKVPNHKWIERVIEASTMIHVY